MKVLKFGGTSVGTVESLNNVKRIIEAIEGKAIIVVSALGGLTDMLISMAQRATKGEKDWKEDFISVKKRHLDIIDKLVPTENQKQVLNKIQSQFISLENQLEELSLNKTLTESILDHIVSYGERMSSVIVAAIIKNGKRYFSPDFIKTEKWYGKNIADLKLTERLIRETFLTIDDNEKAIVPGFISSDRNTGIITNLGRGGSDYTGALLAASLDAEILEIWTDVDGFMTADPRIVKEAFRIDHLSYTESMELCNFGAKVVYPPTIYPVFHKNIPIKILNTFNLEAPGTLITDQILSTDPDIKGVSALKGISLITIAINESTKSSQIIKRAFNSLSKKALRIFSIANPEPESEFNFAVSTTDIKDIISVLEEEFREEIYDGIMKRPTIKNNLAAIALVGKNMKSFSRLAARIGHSLRRSGINVEAFSTGNSDTTIMYIINQEKSLIALPLIHSLVFSV